MNATRFRRADALRGFTMIELMIVLAIIGILAAIAIPIYSNFIAKAQFSEAFSLAGSLQTAVEDQYRANRNTSGGKPLTGIDSGTGGLPAASAVSGHYVSTAAVKDGVITVTFGSDSSMDGKQVTLTPQPGGARFSWSCDTDAAAARTPSSCR